LLNAAIVRSVAIEVEVATFDGFSVVDVFTRTDSVTITGNSLEHELLWQRNDKTYSLDALPQRAPRQSESQPWRLHTNHSLCAHSSYRIY